MLDQVQKSITAEKPASRDQKRRSWVRIILWVLLVIGIALAVIAAVLWSNRYSLIERLVRKELGKAGISADFQIESAHKTGAILKNLQLSDKSGSFFSTDTLKLGYRFDKVRAGIVDKITLTDPVLKLTLDKNGTLIDTWIPKSTNGDSPINFPKDGINIENGVVNWKAPWGSGAAQIDANIDSTTSWESHVEMNAARFEQQDVEFDFSFTGDIDRISGDELLLKGALDLPSARIRQSRVGPFQSEFNIRLTSDKESDLVGATGRLNFKATDLELPAFAAKSVNLDLDVDAKVDPAAMANANVNAKWTLDSEDLTLTDKNMRGQLVRRTMSYDTLSKTPISMHFVDEIEKNGRRFLEKFSVHGAGTYARDAQGYEVDFSRPMILTSPGQKIVLTPDLRPEIKFRSAQKLINLDLHVDWINSRALKFTNFKFNGRSENGLVLTGVDHVAADVKSLETWRRTVNGRPVRLAPLKIKLDYNNSSTGGRVLLRGDIDYDGLLPGGRADALRAGGDVVVKTIGNNFAVSYQPDKTITMAEFISTTGWRAENISFDLVDGTDVLKRVGGAQPLQTTLINVLADIASPADDRHLAVQFDQMRVRSNFQTNPQIWEMDIAGIGIQSEDFPSPGTRIESNSGTARVTQSNTGKIEFRVESPVTKISTDNVQVTDLFIEISGEPNDFSANYKAGAVQLKGGVVPVVPMQGIARLQDGVLSGSAVAPMPRTKNTPIYIDYRSEEGVGTAHISIPKVVFTPRGLQPQYLIPALSGKLAAVSGEASAEFDFKFGGGEPVSSKGTTTLKNMDIGTLVGPASGVSAELTFKSMFPLETDGVQTATLAGFDAGFPLENGTVKFNLVEDGVLIDEAIWPLLSEEFGDGRIYISPMLWRFGNVENKAIVNVENLSLGEILKSIGNGSLSGTGQISGKMPATIKGVDVLIDGGVLAIKDGGVIRYRNQGIDTFAKDTKQPFFLGDKFSGSETGFAFKALENFEYKELEAIIDGPLDGDMTLRMLFGGKNPNLLSGTAFEFNVSVSGELGNIARDSIGAFDAQKHLGAIIDMQKNPEQKSAD